MTWLYVLGAAVSIGLLVYLIYVLIKAEEF
jgi:K+-transporting ATPase KdpF subunit